MYTKSVDSTIKQDPQKPNPTNHPILNPVLNFTISSPKPLYPSDPISGRCTQHPLQRIVQSKLPPNPLFPTPKILPFPKPPNSTFPTSYIKVVIRRSYLII